MPDLGFEVYLPRQWCVWIWPSVKGDPYLWEINKCKYPISGKYSTAEKFAFSLVAEIANIFLANQVTQKSTSEFKTSEKKLGVVTSQIIALVFLEIEWMEMKWKC